MGKAATRKGEVSFNSAAAWIGLAILALLLSGALALALVVGRTPVISDWLDDPHFFRRALVIHVNLALWGWFLAYAAGLRVLVDGPGNRWRHRAGLGLAAGGLFAVVASAGMRGAEPILVNYIPVVDHPLYLWGLGAFFAGVMLEICRLPRVEPATTRRIGASAAWLWRSAFLIALISLWVFGMSWLGTPSGLGVELYYELLFWGVGHTLIVLLVVVMLGAWTYLLTDRHGREPFRPGWALAIAAGLIVPLIIAPMMTLNGTVDAGYVRGFTRLMQFGIVGPVAVAIVLCVPALWRDGVSRAGRWAFLVSASLTVVGFGLGAMIHGSDTMIPAHYHASLGAITVAVMALTFAFLEIPGWTPSKRWWKRFACWQPVIFGTGQLVFAAGFAVSGIFGMDRKAYGADQIIDSTGAMVGLFTMGIGGLMAVAGGAGFLILISAVLIDRLRLKPSTIHPTRRLP